MDKVSGILGASKRVTSTSFKDTGTVRPGALSFGRTVGQSSPRIDHSMTTAERAVQIHNDLLKARLNPEERRTKIVDELSDDFFMQKVEMNVPTIETGINSGMTQEVLAQNIGNAMPEYIHTGEYLDVEV